MNYNNPELIERLAAEYVLGTLRGRARDRFDRLLQNSYATRVAVWSWEAQLNPLGKAATSVAPPASLWPSIQRRLGFVPQSLEKTKSRKTNVYWQTWSILATAASVILALLLVINSVPVSQPTVDDQRLAIFQSESAQPQWLLSFDLNEGRLKAKALNVSAVEAGRALELWVLPEAGAAPRSLGLMPVANQRINVQLTEALVALLRNADGLAISLEPEGGSPTGQPTGPVLYQSELVSL